MGWQFQMNEKPARPQRQLWLLLSFGVKHPFVFSLKRKHYIRFITQCGGRKQREAWLNLSSSTQGTMGTHSLPVKKRKILKKGGEKAPENPPKKF